LLSVIYQIFELGILHPLSVHDKGKKPVFSLKGAKQGHLAEKKFRI